MHYTLLDGNKSQHSQQEAILRTHSGCKNLVMIKKKLVKVISCLSDYLAFIVCNARWRVSS